MRILQKIFSQNFSLIMILFTTLLPLIFIFNTSDLPHTHDGLVHLPRIGAFYKSLLDGQFPVRYAGDLNYGYGMPLFNFIYQLPYFIASLFISLGASLVNSFKLSLSLSFILSGIFMYLFAKEFFKDDRKALLITVFYQFAPFRLVELLIRGSFGEVYTYTFLPLIFLGLYKLIRKTTFNNFLLTSFATSLLVLSHNSISLVFFGVAALFVIFFARGKKILVAFASLLAGLTLSAYYWVPALLEHHYTYGNLYMKNIYLSHFPPFLNFFIPNFFNNPSLQTEGISVQIGLSHVIALVIGMVLLFTKKISGDVKILFIFCAFFIVVSLFFMQPISKPLWAALPLLRQFQFPWRFIAILNFTTALLSVGFLYIPVFKKQIAYSLLLFLTVFTTAYYWKPGLGYDTINEAYYWNFPLNTTYYGETDLTWSAGPAKSYPVSRIEIIEGKGNIENFTKKSNLQTFTIYAKTNVKIVSKTQYYPGWRVFVDKKEIDPSEIQFQDPNWRGLITFPVARGQHMVRLEFGENKLRASADLVSWFSVASFAVLWGIQKRRAL